MMTLEILIPTFRRASFLRRNIVELARLARSEGVADVVGLSISDNASTDDTRIAVEDACRSEGLRLEDRDGTLLIAGESPRVRYHRQSDNVGLERNALDALVHARSSHVMFLGDDDFLPAGYLRFVVDAFTDHGDLGCVVPGFESAFPDGRVVVDRTASYQQKHFSRGFFAQARLVAYGHQLSGLAFRRDGVVEAYTRDPLNRNIYLFMFFIGFNLARGGGIFAPRFLVRVTEGNPKDWRYDAGSLVPDIVKNFRGLHPGNPLGQLVLTNVFLVQQRWRLHAGRGIRGVPATVHYLLMSPKVDILTKATLPVSYLLAAGVGALLRLSGRRRWDS